MNILFVADVSIENVIGGAERVLFEQSTRLSQRGHDVHILTRKLGNQKQSREVINSVNEWRYDVDKKSNFTFLKTTCHNSKSLFKLLQKKYNFEIINFHQPFSALAVIQSPLNNNAKKIYTCHSLSFEEYISRNIKPKGLAAKTLFLLDVNMRRRIEKRVLKKSNEVIVLSRFTQEKLWLTHKIPPQKVSVIPGGVDLIRFQPVDDKIEIRRRLSIHNGRVVLFTVRNLVPRMGLENLILAMQKVIKNTPDIFLVIGGVGPLKNDLIELAKKLGLENHIQFAGFIAEEELANYYRMADLFILPTRELEGFGLVTLEALACGVAVLGTPVGGTQEILGKFDPSFLFEATSSDAMATLILKKHQIIKENPNKCSDLSKRCRKFVEENYSWEKNVDSLEKIFLAKGITPNLTYE
jgi:glycosyltransferase involved in cell wall biosynthesis